MKTKEEVINFLKDEKDARIRYFDMLITAITRAEIEVLKSRQSMTEEMLKAGNSSRFTSLLLDTLLASAYVVGGTLFSAAVNGFVGAIVGTRSRVLWVHRPDGKLEAGLLIKKGRLSVHTLKGPKGPQVLQEMKKAEVEASKIDRATMAWKMGAEILSDSAVLSGFVSEEKQKWPASDIRKDKRSVPLIRAITDSAESQKAIENKLMNKLLTSVQLSPLEDFANDVYDSVESIAMKETEWSELSTRYERLFTAFVWLQYIGQPDNVATGSAYLQAKRFRGNRLKRDPSDTGSVQFTSSVKIKHPELCAYMSETCLYLRPSQPSTEPSPRLQAELSQIQPGLTVWEYFVARKHVLFPNQKDVHPLSAPRNLGHKAVIGQEQGFFSGGGDRQLFHELVGLYLIPSMERLHSLTPNFQKVVSYGITSAIGLSGSGLPAEISPAK